MATHPIASKNATQVGVRTVLREALQLGARADAFTANTLLLGHVAELDSMAVATVLAGLEEHFDIEIDDEDISAEVFESFGSLCDLIDEKTS